MIEALFGFLGGPVASGITGLLGGWLTKREESKVIMAKLEHEKAVMQFQLDSQKLEMQHALDVADKNLVLAQTEGDIDRDIKDMDAMIAAINAQSKPSIPWIDAILKFVRPGLTIWVLYLFSRTSADISRLSGGLQNLDANTLEDLLIRITIGMINLTFLAVGWWFGSRGGNLQGKK